MDTHSAVKVNLDYVSAGASQSPLVLIILPTRTSASGSACEEKHATCGDIAVSSSAVEFAYASHGNLIIARSSWDSTGGCHVAAVFAAHQTATISCVKLIAFDNVSVRILTAGSDGKWKLWNLLCGSPVDSVAGNSLWLRLVSEQQLNGTVTAIGGIIHTNNDLCYIAAVDSTFQLTLYRKRQRTNDADADKIADDSNFGRVFSLKTDHNAVNDVEFTSVSNGDAEDSPSSILLACATANTVTIYGVDDRLDADGQFALTKLCNLHGHEAWIQHLSFSPVQYSTIDGARYRLLASASQDSTVRLWRIAVKSKTQANLTADDTFESLIEQTISNRFEVPSSDPNIRNICTATYEALLFGHDGWVYSAHWMCNNRSKNEVQLVTASLDKTIIIWKETSVDAANDAASHVWSETCRLGIVGGNLPGFYGAVPFVASDSDPVKCDVIAHSFTGSIHIWSNTYADDTWQSRVSIGGHSQPVQSICWSPAGTSENLYLLTSGFDQATRLHGRWQNDDIFEWHELARPQIHGHDINVVCVIGRFMFASGAEEKVIRLFQAPKNFRENFARITCGRSASNDAENADLPEGANVPSLGLSNKPVYAASKSRKSAGFVKNNAAGDMLPQAVTDDDDEARTTDRANELYPEVYFKPLSLSKPPTEEDLLQHTLWAEMHKLYGHPNEIFALCSTTHRNVTLLASACKANKKDLASIFVWDLTETVSTPLAEQRVPPPIVDELIFHTATVTQMRFCPTHVVEEDQFLLLSVSRDRTWALWSRSKSNAKFALAATSPAGIKGGGHSRIIWCCAWSPCGRFFVTGSRDKALAVWLVTRHPPEQDAEDCSITVELQAKLSFPEPVMAVDVCMLHGSNENEATFLFAVGLENGFICFRRARLSTMPFKVLCDAENLVPPRPSHTNSDDLLHNGAVQQLAFAWRKKPLACEKCRQERGSNCSSCSDLLLASSGADHSVRIFSLEVCSTGG